MSHFERAVALLTEHVGKEEGVSDWFVIDQTRIDAFAHATLDEQFIHVDPERAAAETPYGGTIAHGFLTLSLVVYLGEQIPAPAPEFREGLLMGVNYGLDKVRFPAPVVVGSRIRARRVLTAVETPAPLTLQRRQLVTIELEGSKKPACVVEILTRLFYAD